ncbi:MAG: hypothetical protein LBG10_02835 [Treponema sp.]|jgi:hypothetical protein|nr:hypothetical protein [Treponema sp.]
MRKFTQKTSFVFCSIILAFSLPAAGCVTNVGPYDQTNLAENDCTLVLEGSLVGEPITRITSFNGKPVDWRGDFGIPLGIWAGKSFHVQIPAGEHTLTGSTHAFSANDDSMSIINGPELTTTFNFAAGHIYKAEITGDSILQFIRAEGV